VVNQGIIQYRKIISIYEVENEDVYDITVPKNHNFFANSICVHNCGEIIMPTGCCNLGSINLVKFIINPKDENVSPKFDYDLYKSQIQRAVRFLDNINDISTTPLPEYAEALKSKRRIGLGIMGLGSVHFMLGIRYGSPESIEFVNKLFKIKCETELLESAKLGKEKGSFLTFNKDKYFNTYWWKNLKISESIKREIEEIGCMRNSHRAANAPNGNTSLLAGIVSGGIEPVYMKSYTRWSVVNDYEKRKLINANVEFPNTQSGE
jgi:ribonucleoside-diphosphate reductase alpha chain